MAAAVTQSFNQDKEAKPFPWVPQFERLGGRQPDRAFVISYYGIVKVDRILG